MSKPKMFLDCDSTITNSVLAYTDTYNILYANHPEFKLADPNKLQRYDLKDICPLVNNPLDIFDHDLFFKHLDFINDNTYEVLEKLNKKYQLIIVTIGTPINLSKKSLFLSERLPFIKDYVLLRNDGCKMNKSICNMKGKGNVFLDDIKSNLDSSNCETKILFGKRFDWNRNWIGSHCLTWSDIENRFLVIMPEAYREV